MALIPVPPDASLEACAHRRTASEVQERLTRTPRKRLRTHGHIAVARARKFNKDPVGVMGVLLKHPEIQMNVREFGGEERNTLLHLHDEDEDEENRTGSMLLILKRPDLDPNVGNSKGDTPLHSFARASSVACVNILRKDSRINLAAVNHNKQTALHVACEASSKETSESIAGGIIDSARSTVRSLTQFLRKQDRFGNTALHYAAARGLENVVVDLISEAQSLGNHKLALKENHDGNLAIHLAAKNGHLGVVKRMLGLVEDSQVVEVIVNIKDHDGFGLLHHAVRSGNLEILQHCIQRLPMPTNLTFDLYMELLAVAPNKTFADLLLLRLSFEADIVNISERKEDGYLRKLLNFAVVKNRVALLKYIVQWYPKLAVVTMREAREKQNETIQAVLRDDREVQWDDKEMHREHTLYLTAANAILVVAVLILTLTFGHCLTSFKAAELRKDISELMQFGGPPGIRKLHWTDFIVLTRWAFIQAMIATILAAFASLPFSFAFFFREAVDGTKVQELLSKTKVLIVSAAYFLMLSIGALFFGFVCSQFIAPYTNYKCGRACIVALSMGLLCATLFLGYNFVFYWTHRNEGDQQGQQGHGDAHGQHRNEGEQQGQQGHGDAQGQHYTGRLEAFSIGGLDLQAREVQGFPGGFKLSRAADWRSSSPSRPPVRVSCLYGPGGPGGQGCPRHVTSGRPDVRTDV